eukprot:353021-Chlamydomonas_euryale.AAC.4
MGSTLGSWVFAWALHETTLPTGHLAHGVRSLHVLGSVLEQVVVPSCCQSKTGCTVRHDSDWWCAGKWAGKGGEAAKASRTNGRCSCGARKSEQTDLFRTTATATAPPHLSFAVAACGFGCSGGTRRGMQCPFAA